jgi:ATP-dependent DNA ligase
LAQLKGAPQGVNFVFSSIEASMRLDEHYVGNGDIVYRHPRKLGCDGIVSERFGSLYVSDRSPHWLRVKNPAAPAVWRETEEDWSR